MSGATHLTRAGEGKSLTQYLEGWVSSLSALPRTTRDVYVGDVAHVARTLDGATGQSATAPPASGLAELREIARRVDVGFAALWRCAASLDRLTTADLSDDAVVALWASLRDTRGVSHAWRETSAFRSFLRYLVACGALPRLPAERATDHLPPVVRAEYAPLSRDEEATLYAACARDGHTRLTWATRDLAMIRLLLAAGLRKDELLALPLAALDTTGRSITVDRRTGSRVVPLDPETVRALAAYVSERERRFGEDDEHLFVRTDGTAFGARSLYRLVARIFELADVAPRPGSLVHLLRVTYAQRTREAGADPRDVQRLLGHVSRASTRRLLAAHEN